MIRAKTYVDLNGREFVVDDLDADERRLLQNIRRQAQRGPDWNAFDNNWLPQVAEFYRRRGLRRRQTIETAIFQIAQDLSSRLGIDQGKTRRADYRDELADLIQARFKSQGEFCKATGLSTDMLSHVLARRKHLGIDTLQSALERIGFTLRIVPRTKAAKRNGTHASSPRPS
ncbi:MAG: hypothetical protein FJ271_12790 [Planctomycetes bacterium]|nr:hypothetical protein [Planctomycetota bacterium]